MADKEDKKAPEKYVDQYVWHVPKPRSIGTMVIEPSRAVTPTGSQTTVPSSSCRIVWRPAWVEIDPVTRVRELGPEVFSCADASWEEKEQLERLFGKDWKKKLAEYLTEVSRFLGIVKGKPVRAIPVKVPEEYAEEVRAFLATKGVSTDGTQLEGASNQFNADFAPSV